MLTPSWTVAVSLGGNRRTGRSAGLQRPSVGSG
jgi:hypothetical protein